MNTKRRKITAGKIAVLAIAALSITLFTWWVTANQKPLERENLIRFAEVGRGNLEMLVSSTGTLAAVETVEIGTQVSGTIDQLMTDYNDTVEEGQILAVLDQSIFNASVNNAKAGVIKAQAELQQAEFEYKRNKPLYEKGYLSEQEFLPFETEVETLKASLLSAEAVLEQARINLEHTVITSPIDGTVIDRSVDAGQTVAASLATPTLFLIAKDLSRMQIETNVDETDIGQIQKGQMVRFTVQSYSDQTFTGSVRQIRLQPETVDNVVTYTVIVEAENNSGILLPGMTATVDFIVHSTESALLVPIAALQFNPVANERKTLSDNGSGAANIFCPDSEGRLHPLPVTTGQSDGLVTVVSGEGLTEGMKVATGFSQNQGNQSKVKGFSVSSLFGQGMGGVPGGGGPGGGPGPRP